MGLITALLTLPLAPVRGVAWIGEQIAEEADRQLDPEARMRRQLADLELAHDLGELGDEEFARREEEIFDGE
jgi:Gas vesicle protein G